MPKMTRKEREKLFKKVKVLSSEGLRATDIAKIPSINLCRSTVSRYIRAENYEDYLEECRERTDRSLVNRGLKEKQSEVSNSISVVFESEHPEAEDVDTRIRQYLDRSVKLVLGLKSYKFRRGDFSLIVSRVAKMIQDEEQWDEIMKKKEDQNE
jgi:predicted transcriptional regulator